MNDMHSAPSRAKEEKKAFRQEIKNRWKALEETYLQEASKTICDAIRQLPEYQQAKTVFCFVSMERELNTSTLLDGILADGKTLVVPRVLAMGKMALHPITSLDTLKKSRFGIPEPAEDTPTVSPQDVDFTVVPCLSATLAGARLGRGGGFYDRFLADYTGNTALVCFHQLLSESVPMDSWDVQLPVVVTEKGIWRAK
ncbi:5-formyltetrahydrofolate cyclo-ligase [Levyella massiliensis]|uniref:5-formyltetrahydrofolate cyclo-ligase n=1 Tax=Levyella massiliensis TaxID=938289 RepID=UPI00399B584F